jgi:hypothetical protein
MEFLCSNLPPVRTKHSTFADKFYSLMPKATRIDIAVGYVTADSLAELQQTIANNHNIETLNLIIGMHYFEKFTKPEYNAAIRLNDFLRKECRGEVKLIRAFRFHGKLYTYSNPKGAFAGIIGSNNLSSIVESRTRIYETAAIISEKIYAAKILEFIEVLSLNAADNIADCSIINFKRTNELLIDHENVIKVKQDELADCISALTKVKFNIPLVKKGEVPPKSNLNVFFDKGRVNKTTGIEKPRHWYEVDPMVPAEITRLPGYPKEKTKEAIFDVITDDGWKFTCQIQGASSKNFRSKGDLTILGKWIKGRLEKDGALTVGHVVTPDTFVKYGRDNFTLIKTTTPNLWYLDFGVNK